MRVESNASGAAEGQISFLTAQRERLQKHLGRPLSWVNFAAEVDIPERRLKTYTARGTNFRPMSDDSRELLVRRIDEIVHGGMVPGRNERAAGSGHSALFAAVGSELAALVVRQHTQLLEDATAIVTGAGRDLPGARGGLSEADRFAMALVSRAQLSIGAADTASEIHDLLVACTQPLGEWLGIKEVLDEGLGPVVLIDPATRLPTAEAQDLASDYTDVVARYEEMLFGALQRALAGDDAASADAAYTRVREFAVRNPVASEEDIYALVRSLRANVGSWLGRVYQALPVAKRVGAPGKPNTVALCTHCSNLIERDSQGVLRCSTRACREQRSYSARTIDGEQRIAGLRRLPQALLSYWHEPGVDELVLYDELRRTRSDVRLYPHRDRVDIDLGAGSARPVGIDVKSHRSPELLGRRLGDNPGGLSGYARRLVVVPDWLTRTTPDYIERLQRALGSQYLQAASVSSVLREFGNAL